LLPRLEIDATVDDEPEKVALAWLNGWQNKPAIVRFYPYSSPLSLSGGMFILR
jgi:hypothetical protein